VGLLVHQRPVDRQLAWMTVMTVMTHPEERTLIRPPSERGRKR
jgi:hypothetical protein